LKEEVLDRTLWRTRFGSRLWICPKKAMDVSKGGYEPVVRRPLMCRKEGYGRVVRSL